MSDITGAERKIQIEGTRFGSAVSESLIQTLGGSINWLIDQVDPGLADLNAHITTIAGNHFLIVHTYGSTSTNGQTYTLGSGDVLFVIPNQTAVTAGFSLSGGTFDANGYAFAMSVGPGTVTANLSGGSYGYLFLKSTAVST